VRRQTLHILDNLGFGLLLFLDPLGLVLFLDPLGLDRARNQTILPESSFFGKKRHQGS
jgi:hypothetical protein